MNVTSSPVAAIMPGTRLVVGVDRDADDNSARIYFDARYKNLHVHMAPGDQADQMEQAWKGGASSHLWATDVATDALCDCPNEAAS